MHVTLLLIFHLLFTLSLSPSPVSSPSLAVTVLSLPLPLITTLTFTTIVITIIVIATGSHYSAGQTNIFRNFLCSALLLLVCCSSTQRNSNFVSSSCIFLSTVHPFFIPCLHVRLCHDLHFLITVISLNIFLLFVRYEKLYYNSEMQDHDFTFF